MEKGVVAGRKPVLLTIDQGITINKLIISKTAHGSVIEEIIEKAKKNRLVFSFLPGEELDKVARPNQGVIAYATDKEYIELSELIDSLDISKNPVLCVLDEVTDPHNVGAVIRSAYCFGIKGLIIPKRNTCSINSTVFKASAGTAGLMPVSRVANIVNSLKFLKEKGFWIVGAGKSSQASWDYDFDKPLAIVLGSEGKGIRRLVKETCDVSVNIPFSNEFDSLNVSCAGAVLFYEMLRQRNVE